MEEFLRKERDGEILKAYTNLVSSHGFLRLPAYKAAELIANDKAPRFFVSYESARRVVSQMCRGGTVRFSNANKRRMYEDICRAFIKERESTGLPGYLALWRVLSEAAPSYYVNPITLRGIIYRAIKKKECPL